MTSYEKENINEYIEIIQKSNSGVESYIVNETKTPHCWSGTDLNWPKKESTDVA